MIQFLPVGDTALTIEFSREIRADINQRVLQLDRDLGEFQGLLECVPTYRSLLVHFNPLDFDLAKFKAHVLALCEQPLRITDKPRRRLVPVFYDGEDLEFLAKTHNISVEEVIAIHLSAIYRVYMIGFLPGFALMGGLDKRLHTPRRLSPRLVTPAGTISIGGEQALVGSVEAPSGWHLLGRTPMRNFDKTRDPTFILAAGDEVQFTQIHSFLENEVGEWL
jgi:5-oxoprolinase (ATP-hydrolysing) subunit B